MEKVSLSSLPGPDITCQWLLLGSPCYAAMRIRCTRDSRTFAMALHSIPLHHRKEREIFIYPALFPSHTFKIAKSPALLSYYDYYEGYEYFAGCHEMRMGVRVYGFLNWVAESTWVLITPTLLLHSIPAPLHQQHQIRAWEGAWRWLRERGVKSLTVSQLPTPFVSSQLWI